MGVIDTIREKVGGGEVKKYNESTERSLREHNISDRPMKEPSRSNGNTPKMVVTRKSATEAVVSRSPPVSREGSMSVVRKSEREALVVRKPIQSSSQSTLGNVRGNVSAGIEKIGRGVQRVKTSRPAKATVKALDMTYGKAFSVARASRARNEKGERVSIGSASDVSMLGRASRGYARASKRSSSFSAELRSGYRSPNEFGLGLLGKRVSHPYAQKARTTTRLTAYDPMTGATAAPTKPRRRRRRKKTSGTAAPHDNVWTFF
jgi:hypothetical protein